MVDEAPRASHDAGLSETGRVAGINDRLSGGRFQIAIVPIESVEFVAKNARFMKNEQYKRLVDNIKRDGQLSSVPFCTRRRFDVAAPDPVNGPFEFRYRVISGNHRVKAAKDAGLKEILVLWCDEAKFDEQAQTAMQLAHNAIVGQDDLKVLKELYDSIADVELKLYSGLDNSTLSTLEKVEMTTLSELSLDFRTVTLTFLPEEQGRFDKVLDRAKALAAADGRYACLLRSHAKLLDAFELLQSKHKIKNTATAMMFILDVFEKTMKERAEQHDGDRSASVQ